MRYFVEGHWGRRPFALARRRDIQSFDQRLFIAGQLEACASLRVDDPRRRLLAPACRMTNPSGKFLKRTLRLVIEATSHDVPPVRLSTMHTRGGIYMQTWAKIRCADLGTEWIT
jgi:hypothetical protein